MKTLLFLKHPSFPGGCFCFEVITMIYDAMIDTYTRQITALEARLAELRAELRAEFNLLGFYTDLADNNGKPVDAYNHAMDET